jgi:hypothetical protein
VFFHELSKKYSRFLAGFPMPLGWLFVFGASFWFAARPEPAVFFALPLFLSAWILSGVSTKKRRFFRAASVFFLFWYALRFILAPGGGNQGFYPASFLVYVFLGLHMFFVWTPVRIGRGFKRAMSPVIGERRALMVALAFMVITVSLPGILSDAREIKKRLGRLSDLPLRERIALWGQTLARITLSGTDSLARTLSKRQGDLG